MEQGAPASAGSVPVTGRKRCACGKRCTRRKRWAERIPCAGFVRRTLCGAQCGCCIALCRQPIREGFDRARVSGIVWTRNWRQLETLAVSDFFPLLVIHS